MKNKSCCFIGHREIDITEELKKEIYYYIENLIVNENVKIFLFGSRSNFNFLCHTIVTELKFKYVDIKRVGYTAKSESVVLESERKKWEKIYSVFYKSKVNLLGVEEEFEHKTKYMSGKAAYIDRNQAMIDDSDYCVFYYNDNYLPQKKDGKAGYCVPKSGTEIAFKYAMRKKKVIKNFYNN